MTPDDKAAPELREIVANAIEGADAGYHLRLHSLVDGVSTYHLTFEDEQPLTFDGQDKAYAAIAERKRYRGADLALAAIKDAGYTLSATRPAGLKYNLATGERENQETDETYFHAPPAGLDAATVSERPQKFLAWAIDTFGPVAKLRSERLMRFVEESIELAHADDMQREILDAIANRVFSRPKGSIAQEIGQAQVTLEMYAENIEEISEMQAEIEWQRVRGIPREEWQRRHEAKQAIGIAEAMPLALSTASDKGELQAFAKTFSASQRTDGAIIDALLLEMMDRRLLNDVDDDLHQEIGEALVKIMRAEFSPKYEALLSSAQQMRAFISVMFGQGPEARIPETVPSPLGVEIKIGNLMRAASSALSRWSIDK
jgi:hypothetical protein